MGIIKVSANVNQVTLESNTDFNTHILTQYKDLFSNKLGEPPIIYSMTLDPSVQPVFQPDHHIPIAMEGWVIAELNHKQNLGITTPVTEPTDSLFYVSCT